MKKLGVSEKKVAVDVVAIGGTFVEIEEFRDLLDHDEMLGAKIYLRTSQKQVYELSEDKKYAVAHLEQGVNEVFHSQLTKQEVIDLVKANFNDYKEVYILIFEQDDWISLEKYQASFIKQKELTFEEPVIVIIGGTPVCLKTGEGLILSTFTKTGVVFFKKDAIQIKDLEQGELYTVVNLSDDETIVEEFAHNVNSKKVIEMADEYIDKYANKKMLIFKSETGVCVEEYIGKTNEKNTITEEEPAHVCYCCGEDTSRAMWYDVALLRGTILEAGYIVPLDGDEYNCDKWFNQVEMKFRKMGLLMPHENVFDLEGTEFFTLAFSDTFPSKGKEKVECLSDARELRGFEPGAYCLHCHASL